jgi:uncharacterized cupin superfamily protein
MKNRGYTFRMAKQIINISELEFKPFRVPVPESLKEKYEGSRMAFAGPLIGAQKLGFNVTAVPPGKRAVPFHNHRVNEELFFILEGEGEVRIGAETFKIKQGDLISNPPGGAETAHQIINTSDKELKYLAISTKLYPEIADYPDSKKFGVLSENFRYIGREDGSLDYFDGEK